jgi:NitT/TauT family transport system ATP-binding protein
MEAVPTALAATPEPLLRVESLSFAYATGTVALADISLTLSPGEFVSIVGPSGCGKSTLLALVAGSMRPMRGDIRWQAQEKGPRVSRHLPTQRMFTVVFQRDTVLPWLSVERNISLGLSYLELSRAEKKERVEQLLTLGGLTDSRKVLPHHLSGGMRRRVALLSGIAPLPRAILMDEPFAALDEPTRIAIHENLREIFLELGLSVLLVTHDISEALTLSDRIVVLSARPARVASVVQVPFGRDRDLMMLREQADYHDLYAEVWHTLRKEIERSNVQSVRPARS